MRGRRGEEPHGGGERSGRMEAKEFQAFCQSLDAGETKYVENIGSHEKGRVLFCSGNRLEVEVDGNRETWGSEFCRETSGPQ
jgi:hypothetical protein